MRPLITIVCLAAGALLLGFVGRVSFLLHHRSLVVALAVCLLAAGLIGAVSGPFTDRYNGR